ncbi:MAG: PIN domain-containing protein [Chloroflexota bacterium]|nr:PIN domain-containing protein [Chloroflexota bacterium]
MTKELAFVDTSAWFAIKDAQDQYHAAAIGFLADFQGDFVTSNFVIDETITLVLVRLGYWAALGVGEQLWKGKLAHNVRITEDDERAAWELFKRYSDKGFSFTDCPSFAVMERLELRRAFAFDENFSQTGQFLRVPRLQE